MTNATAFTELCHGCFADKGPAARCSGSNCLLVVPRRAERMVSGRKRSA